MISEKENVRLSKLLSYVLRHKPAEIGVEPDSQGWADVEVLLTRLHAEGENISMETLRHIVATNPKQRFSFNDGETKIRANQGHTIEVALDYPQQHPPIVLYHGTVAEVIPAILSGGLKKMSRHHVHLSADVETASKVGMRRGKPVILKIDAAKMFEEGFIFYLTANGVWLTDVVPPQFIQVLPL